ncbi:MAG: hypothetical protein Q8Q36_02460 [bacterium]|nr:hypothetical protein [bacterium]
MIIVSLTAIVILAPLIFFPGLRFWENVAGPQEIGTAIRSDLPQLEKSLGDIATSLQTLVDRENEKAAREAAEKEATEKKAAEEKAAQEKAAAEEKARRKKGAAQKPPATQVRAETGPPKMFATKEACYEALRVTRNFSYYEPRFFSWKNKNPVDGTSKIVAPIEADRCVRMLTTSGIQWVVQREGTLFRWHAVNGAISSPVPYARDDCGNPVDDIDPKGSMRPTADAPKVSVTLVANPTTVPSGGSTVLTWVAQNALSCAASVDWTGEKSPLGGSEVVKNLVGSNKLFAITCNDAAGNQAVAHTPVGVEFKASATEPEWKPYVLPKRPRKTVVVVVQQAPTPQVVYAPQPQVAYAPAPMYGAPVYAAPAYDYGGGGFNLNLAYSRVNINRNFTVPAAVVTPPRSIIVNTRPIGGVIGAQPRGIRVNTR